MGKEVFKGGRITQSSSQSSDHRFVDVSANFADSVPSSKVVTVSGSAPTQTGSKAIFANGSWRSLDLCRYREGRTTELTCTARFVGTPAVGEKALIGVGNKDGTSGFLFGSLDGEDVFLLRKSGSTDTIEKNQDGDWVNSSDWDRDAANVWSLSFLWHGNGPAYLDRILSGRSGFNEVSTLDMQNTRTDASINEPDVYVWIETSANMSIEVSSWALGPYLGSRDNVVSEGNSYDYNVDGTLAASGTFTGEWSDLADFAQANTVIQSDQTLTMDFEYSTDGSTALSGVVPQFMHTGDGTARRFQLGVYARYFRVKLTNTGGSAANLIAQTILLPTESRLSIHRTGDNLTSDRSAEVVKAVVSAQQPDTDWTNAKAAGLARDRDGVDIETTTPLSAAATYTSGWMDHDGWTELEVMIATDQVSATDGIVIEFTDDANTTTPTVRASVTKTFTSESVTEGFLVFRTGTEGDGFRIKYTNGGTPQGSFYLGVVAKPVASTQDTAALYNTLSGNEQAVIMRGPLDAENDAGNWSSIKQSDGGGLRMSVAEQEAELMSKATSTQSQTSLTATSTFAQIDTSKLSNRKYYVISNHDKNTSVYYGVGAGTTTSNGTLLPPETTHMIEATGDVDIYVGTSSATAALSFHQHGGTV